MPSQVRRSVVRAAEWSPMTTGPSDDYNRYIERFERLVGDIRPGQYGKFKGRLVTRLELEQFDAKAAEYLDIGRRFNTMMTSGDTIDDTLIIELRAAEVELVLEQSAFLPTRS